MTVDKRLRFQIRRFIEKAKEIQARPRRTDFTEDDLHNAFDTSKQLHKYYNKKYGGFADFWRETEKRKNETKG